MGTTFGALSGKMTGLLDLHFPCPLHPLLFAQDSALEVDIVLLYLCFHLT